MIKQLFLGSLLIILISRCQFENGPSELERHCFEDSIFQICSDTFYTDIMGRPTSSILVKDKYYSFFTLYGSDYSVLLQKLYLIHKNGKVQKPISLPEEILKSEYHKIQYRHDSIIVSLDENSIAFFLDQTTNQWIKIKSIDNLIYEDSIYYVTSTCSGEFGGTIFFKDKKSNNTYVASSVCSVVVNRINNSYYVTNYLQHLSGFTEVYVIEDPHKLQTKEDFILAKKRESRSREGTVSLLDSMEFEIISSFKNDDKLYHLYRSRDTISIGEIKNRKIEKLYSFDIPLGIELDQDMQNNGQLFRFYTDDKDLFGFIEIKQNQIIKHFIKRNK